MRIAREVALYNQGGIQNGIDTAEDRASKVATSFITRVSEAEGIKVHNADDTSDYIQINSNGVDLVNDNVSIANFGESARVGKNGSSRFMINADSLEAYDDNNEKYFEVSPDGMTYGAHTVADTAYADGKASAAQSAAISTASADATSKASAAQSAAAADATSKANEAAKTATNFITTDSTGIKVHNTNDTSNYTHIGSGGMDVYQGDASNPVASFGSAAAQVGKSSTGHVTIQATGMKVYSNATNEIANIGYDTSGMSPYYTFGSRTGTVGGNSVAEGQQVIAKGINSHAEGSGTQANGQASHAGGFGTIAEGDGQTAIGKYNVSDLTSMLLVGNGTSASSRSNALKIDADGNAHIKGKLYAECNADSSGGHLVGVVKGTLSNVSSLPKIIYSSYITADMEVLHCVLSNPSAQTGDWTVTTATDATFGGKATISGNISGTTNITLYFATPT